MQHIAIDTGHPECDFSFSPRPKSKLLDGSSSDSDRDDSDKYLVGVDTSDRWLTKNERKRQKKIRKRQLETSPELSNFKKQDKKTTPKNNRN